MRKGTNRYSLARIAREQRELSKKLDAVMNFLSPHEIKVIMPSGEELAKAVAQPIRDISEGCSGNNPST